MARRNFHFCDEVVRPSTTQAFGGYEMQLDARLVAKMIALSPPGRCISLDLMEHKVANLVLIDKLPEAWLHLDSSVYHPFHYPNLHSPFTSL